MTDLERYRDEIDEIDSEIVRLFEKRMKVSEEVAEYKIKTGKQVLDPARESQKIHTLKNKAHGDFNSLGVQELFRQIMAISRKRQYQLLTEHGIYGERNFTTVKHVPLENATVVFQGVEGAYMPSLKPWKVILHDDTACWCSLIRCGHTANPYRISLIIYPLT